MSDPRLEPLEPSVEALLDGERASALRPDLDEVQARVRRAVQARIGGDGGGGDGGDGGGAPAPSSGAPTGLAGGGATAIGLGGTAMGLVLGVALGLGAGLPAGWMLHQWTAPVPVAVAPTELRAPEPAPAPPLPAPVPEVVPEPVPVVAPTPAPAPAPDLAPDFGDTEQARIDQARVALRRGRPHDALVALMSHAREYPTGQLAEERDRLTIEALVAQGRLDQAQTRLEDFRTQWPASIHLAALEALFTDGGPP